MLEVDAQVAARLGKSTGGSHGQTKRAARRRLLARSERPAPAGYTVSAPPMRSQYQSQ